MKIDDRLKRIIFKKLVKDLSHVEIIPHKGSIWFIDRNDRSWYLELKNSGNLWWKYYFFDRFFQAFSLEQSDYEPLIAEWVEQVLNHIIDTTQAGLCWEDAAVEEVLNDKVNTTFPRIGDKSNMVEQVLNYKVNTTIKDLTMTAIWVENVLDHMVNMTENQPGRRILQVEYVLNSK
jgi:hypothetical protein